MIGMVRQEVLPAVSRYVQGLAEAVNAKRQAVSSLPCRAEAALIEKLSGQMDKAFELVEELDEKLGNSRSRSMNILSAATYYRDVLVPAMEELRGAVDAMEVHVSAERWPYPTYADLMFRV